MYEKTVARWVLSEARPAEVRLLLQENAGTSEAMEADFLINVVQYF